MIYSFSGVAESKVAVFRQAPGAHPKIITQHASYRIQVLYSIT
jgi:hypothetical protein